MAISRARDALHHSGNIRHSLRDRNKALAVALATLLTRNPSLHSVLQCLIPDWSVSTLEMIGEWAATSTNVPRLVSIYNVRATACFDHADTQQADTMSDEPDAANDTGSEWPDKKSDHTETGTSEAESKRRNKPFDERGTETTKAKLLEQLQRGDSLRTACSALKVARGSTLRRWRHADSAFNAAIERATVRDVG